MITGQASLWGFLERQVQLNRLYVERQGPNHPDVSYSFTMQPVHLLSNKVVLQKLFLVNRE
jgi:hypothetical protein